MLGICTSTIATVLLLLALLPAPAQSSLADEEEVTMQKLRHVLNDVDSEWVAHAEGWHSSSAAHHCTWKDVQCNEHGRVTRLLLVSAVHEGEAVGQVAVHASSNGGSSNHSAASGPLLPELAQMQWLEMFIVALYTDAHWAGIPAEWGVPGAFPSLQRLSITALSLAGGLPDIQPGALPQLTTLEIEVQEWRRTLPASWGRSPDVLPQLEQFSLAYQIQGQLPAEWAAGFRQLRTLDIINLPPGAQWFKRQAMKKALAAQHPSPASKAGAAVVQELPLLAAGMQDHQPTQRQLPWQWGAGFPLLLSVELVNLGLTGAIPPSWQTGFPKLEQLDLSFNLLTELPKQLPRHHPSLSVLILEYNWLAGSLPASWADFKGEVLRLKHNALTGPAFPEAWLQRGALGALRSLELSGNPKLTGTLPANLSWPNLSQLDVGETGLGGTIPLQWCQAPFAGRLTELSINGTAVVPQLPSCGVGELSYLQLDVSQHSGPMYGGWHLSAGGLLALLVPLGALAAAAAANNTVAKKRHGQRRHWLEALQQPDEEQLLSEAPSSACSSKSSLLKSSQLSRRAQLTAQLTAEVVEKQHRVELVPVEAFPETLALQVSPQPMRWQSQVDSTAGSTGKQRQDRLPPVLESDEEADDQMSTASTFKESVLMPPGSLQRNRQSDSHRSHSRHRSVPSCDSQQRWTLDSVSLQLGPDELEFVTDSKGLLIMLGEGSHAGVYLGKVQGREVAVKVFELEPDADRNHVCQEVNLLRRCEHAGIVPLYGVAIKGHLLMLVMELMRGGSLRGALFSPQKQHALRWEARGRQIAIELAQAVDFLHNTLRIMHSDLKPSNVLLTEDFHACIADLGMARVVEHTARTAAGFTFTHAAPEQLMGARCTLAADIYSLGIVLAELTSSKPVRKRGDLHMPEAPWNCPQGVRDLIEDCLQQDSLRRPTSSQVLERLQAS